MILDCEVSITEKTPDFTGNTQCLDRLITIGSLAYDPATNKVAEESFKSSGVGLFLIQSSIFPQYLNARNTQYPIYPTLNRGFANNVTKDTYDKIKEAYEICKRHVTVPYNTSIFNLSKTHVYRHRHTFASPYQTPLNSEVFTLKLTDNSPSKLEFTIFNHDETSHETALLEHGQRMCFNGLLPHEVNRDSVDTNYYGFFLFEEWPE